MCYFYSTGHIDRLVCGIRCLCVFSFSFSIFTLNGHLCDRHLPLPGDCLTGWKNPASLLTQSAPLLASLMPTGILHLMSQSSRSTNQHLRPGSWPEGLKPGHGRHSVPWQPLPTEGRTATTSLPNGIVQTNKQTNKQKMQIQTQVKETTHSERHKAKTQKTRRCLGAHQPMRLVSPERLMGRTGGFGIPVSESTLIP